MCCNFNLHTTLNILWNESVNVFNILLNSLILCLAVAFYYLTKLFKLICGKSYFNKWYLSLGVRVCVGLSYNEKCITVRNINATAPPLDIFREMDVHLWCVTTIIIIVIMHFCLSLLSLSISLVSSNLIYVIISSLLKLAWNAIINNFGGIFEKENRGFCHFSCLYIIQFRITKWIIIQHKNFTLESYNDVVCIIFRRENVFKCTHWFDCSFSSILNVPFLGGGGCRTQTIHPLAQYSNYYSLLYLLVPKC